MNNYKEIKEVCQRFNSGFDGVEHLIMDWGREKSQLKKPLREILSIDDDGRYPEGYGSQSAGNYLLSLALTDPKIMQQLYVKNEVHLTTKAKQALSFWQKQPAFWCFFSVNEILKDQFLQIEDLLTKETHLLYSPGISKMQKDRTTRNKHYLCLMLPNGECLQTAGILRFNALTASDLLFYCFLFEPEASLTTVINNHYSKFFVLDEISTLPFVIHRGHDLKYVWHAFTLPDFDISRLGGTWEIGELGTKEKFYLTEPDESMSGVPHAELLIDDFPTMGATLYRDNSTGEMGLQTNTEASYALFAALLERSYPELVLPEQPTVAISMSLFMLLEELGLPVPWAKFNDLQNLTTEADEENESLEKPNLLLQHYMEAKNKGKSFDLEAFCKKEGIPIEDATAIIKAVEKQYKQMAPPFNVAPEDEVFELSGWPVPPPATLRLFSSDLCDSDLFELQDDRETRHQFQALTGGEYTDEIEEEGLCEYVENMFFDYFDYDLSYFLMNSFYWIFYHKGREWVPARSYALEILKLFPRPIGRLYPEPEDFIQEFSEFIKRILCNRGLCTLSSRPRAAAIKKGTYTIKATEAFYSMFSAIKE